MRKCERLQPQATIFLHFFCYMRDENMLNQGFTCLLELKGYFQLAVNCVPAWVSSHVQWIYYVLAATEEMPKAIFVAANIRS